MKKAIVLLLSCFLFFACAIKKKTVKTHAKSVVEQIKSDSISSVNVLKSEPIHDVIFIGLNTDDKKLNELLTSKLKHVYSLKKSGNNFVKVQYDTIKKGLRIHTKIGATKDSIVDYKSTKTFDKNTTTNNTVNSKTKKSTGIPFWLIVVLFVIIPVAYIIKKYSPKIL